MALGRVRDEQKEQQWQRRIEQWRASGLSVRDFCDRHGLATPSFYNWRRTLQRRHCRSFRSSRVLPGAMMVPSFRRDYTTAVKNAIHRTDTIIWGQERWYAFTGRG